jgi:Domain of unknown function (DUF362)
VLLPSLFLRCPETGKIRGINKGAWPKWAFLLSGIAATVWFLIRVVPKPSRIAYPCQKVSASFMISFLVYVGSLAGSVFAFRKARGFAKNSKFLYGALFLLLSAVCLLVFISNRPRAVAASANAPIGTAKGIYPGRVTWVYNPNAAMWRGTGNYWSANVNPQAEYNRAFTAGIESLSGGADDSTSWDKMFKYFNANHGRTGTGYQAGDSIAIKINQNNSAASATDPGNVMNANPQTEVAILTSLVKAGVPEGEITIGDPSRAVTDNIFNAIHSAFPKVRVIDYFGNNGRITSPTTANVFPNTDVVTGQITTFYNARYIISQPLMKGHTGTITFGAKNFYGTNGIFPDWTNNGNKHPAENALTNYMTNAHFGGKVVLWAMDAMYPSPQLDGAPWANWAEAPFNGKPMSSFILSQDGVAEESVSWDFFLQHSSATTGGEYITDAANGGAGVEEHWNNNTARQYSRNLDPVNGKGIELDYVNTSLITGTASAEAGSPAARNFEIREFTSCGAEFVLPARGDFLLSVFTMDGSRVADVARGIGDKGENRISRNGLHVSNGKYLIRLSSNGRQVEKQITIMN